MTNVNRILVKTSKKMSQNWRKSGKLEQVFKEVCSDRLKKRQILWALNKLWVRSPPTDSLLVRTQSLYIKIVNLPLGTVSEMRFCLSRLRWPSRQKTFNNM